MEASKATCPQGTVSWLIAELARASTNEISSRLVLSRKTRRYVHAGILQLYTGLSQGSPSAIDEVRTFTDVLYNTSLDAPNITIRLPFSIDLELNISEVSLIRVIRQVYLLLWKNSFTSPPSGADQAIARLRLSGTPHRGCVSYHHKRLVKKLLGPVPDIYNFVGRHGPGAVAERYTSVEKWRKEHVISRAIYNHPIRQLLSWNPNHFFEQTYTLSRYAVTRLIEVPKDVRSKRIISAEPCSSMFLQQSVMDYLMKRLERHNGPSGRSGEIQFSSQEYHAQLLKDHGCSYATIDLSNASDMVSRRLVWNLLPPDWKALLWAIRSWGISHNNIVTPLRAFTPMGSAICFPIEALVHYVCIRVLIPSAPISVYGDDILVPTQYFDSALRALSAFGLVPNSSKSYAYSRFRETCGFDYWADTQHSLHDISIAYLRANLTKGKLSIYGMMACARSLVSSGCIDIALAIYRAAYKAFPAYRGTPLLGAHAKVGWPDELSSLDATCQPLPTRWDPNYQVLRVRAAVVGSSRTAYPDGYVGLLLSRRDNRRPGAVPYRLLTSKVRINCRWLAIV